MWRAAVIAGWLASPLAAQEFFTLKGHGGPIMDIAVSPSGQIATASFDNSVGLWTGQTPRWLEAHKAAVTTVVFAAETLLASGGDDFIARLWLPQQGLAQEIGTHQGKIADIAFHPATGRFATASWDGTIGLFTAGDALAEIPKDRVAFTQRFLEGHGQGVNDVAFSGDGQSIYSASADGTIRLWDVATGRETRRLVNHGFGINTLVLNEDAGWLAYGASDGGTRMIDLATGAAIADFTADRRPILAMDFHGLTGQLAVGDGQGYIMMIDTGTHRVTRDFRAARQGPIWALAFSPSGQNLHAGGIEDIVYSFAIDTMEERGPIATETRSFLEDPDSMPNGERQFKRKCSICHTLTEGSARKAGPSLHALFGRRAGTVADYRYSPTLEASDIVWSAATIDDLFDIGPDHYIPGTKMPMQRIAQPSDRDDLIDYLRIATKPGGN